MSNTINTDYAHILHPVRHARPRACHVCATCYNTACPVKRDLALYSGIDCGALFRVLDLHGFVCEYQPVPALEVPA